MSTPKFAVGEVVIVAGNTRPCEQGEHTVHLILTPGARYFDRITRSMVRTIPLNQHHSGFGYIMEDLLLDHDGHEVIFDQSCLRKKHVPGEDSFNEIMQDLKNKEPTSCVPPCSPLEKA